MLNKLVRLIGCCQGGQAEEINIIPNASTISIIEKKGKAVTYYNL